MKYVCSNLIISLLVFIYPGFCFKFGWVPLARISLWLYSRKNVYSLRKKLPHFFDSSESLFEWHFSLNSFFWKFPFSIHLLINFIILWKFSNSSPSLAVFGFVFDENTHGETFLIACDFLGQTSAYAPSPTGKTETKSGSKHWPYFLYVDVNKAHSRLNLHLSMLPLGNSGKFKYKYHLFFGNNHSTTGCV